MVTGELCQTCLFGREFDLILRFGGWFLMCHNLLLHQHDDMITFSSLSWSVSVVIGRKSAITNTHTFIHVWPW